MEVVQEHFPNNHIFYIGLYGSQNYGLDTEKSDVDTKCIVLPTNRDLILGREPISCELDVDGEICCVKDIRAMNQNFLKGNINFLEILFTKYWYCPVKYQHKVYKLRANVENIAYSNPHAIVNMAYGMVKSKSNIVLAIGDKKKLKTVCRVTEFLKNYSKNLDFETSLIPNDEVKKELMSIMNTELTDSEIKNMVTEAVIEADKAAQIVREQNFPKEQTEWAKKFLDDLTLSILKDQLKDEFFYDTEMEISRLAKRNDELRRENDNLYEDVHQLQCKNDDLYKDIEDLRYENNKLRREKDSLYEYIDR